MTDQRRHASCIPGDGLGVFCIAAALAAFVLCLGARPAGARDLGFAGAKVSGRIGFGVLATRHRTTPGLSGDARLALPLFGGPLGLEFGLFGLATDLDTPHETYATLTYNFGTVAFAAGVPRPAYDMVALSPLEWLAPQIGLGAGRVAATRSRVTWGAMYDGYLPVGARLSGQGGDLAWAVSAHRVDNHHLNVASVGLAWTRPGWNLEGALEWASDGTLAGKAQVVRDLGRMSLGASAYAAPAPGKPDLAEGFLTLKASERLALTALVQVASGTGDTLGVVAAQFGIGQTGRLSVALTAEKGASAASIGMDWKF